MIFTARKVFPKPTNSPQVVIRDRPRSRLSRRLRATLCDSRVRPTQIPPASHPRALVTVHVGPKRHWMMVRSGEPRGGILNYITFPCPYLKDVLEMGH